MNIIKRKWKKQTPPVKGTVIGAGGGLIVFGLKGVGLATMGFGIGLPAVVVTAAGGALIGTGVQIYKDGKRFIRKKQKKARENDG